ncbi:hypothetical protein BKE38_11125 [Pseudoroseomonas deserti]|uniref:Peptidase S8/S53 domain-containing protein n=1 Tax=Teichococcus deserti TaxID=1817963 RepID=A0A1V2H578_9PROT|nr:S8 family peptidase [Pseudoroseomonas deserti]ONG54020.1 hypothetical protein BKE38_11125 [Pseudoroseomonas deserti]
MAEEHKSLAIPRSLVEYVLLGPIDDRRLLQDTPILGDVWIEFAAKPGQPQDLLITPYKSQPAGRVARVVAKRRRALLAASGAWQGDAANIAYLQGVVAARMSFVDMLKVVLPITTWWHSKMTEPRFADGIDLEEFTDIIERGLRPPTEGNEGLSDRPRTPLDSAERYVALAGLMLWAVDDPPADLRLHGDGRDLERLAPGDRAAIAQRVHNLFQSVLEQAHVDGIHAQVDGPLVWQVSLNRRAWAALEKSVPTVKADAARGLFNVSCREITWAVLDSGIDGRHPAFLDRAGGTCRVTKAFDFRHIREVISLDNADQEPSEERVRALLRDPVEAMRIRTIAELKRDLMVLGRDAEEGRPIHWELVEPFVAIRPQEVPPALAHGTHVAGILGGRAVEPGEAARPGPAGMCPDINLYDFRILSRSDADTEFAVIAALQYIRHLNGRSGFMAVHGVNLSLSILHDVRNFACGRTPVCDECARLVDNGVVVVAAAGNRGYQSFETKEGLFGSYAAFSVTDPGNAEDAITVGATHRNWPHTYGVSFFSSRGPTGDGRVKPDLVAPGERITAPILDNKWGELDGTSMATPHVSGGAAMLMARYPELIGRPRRIKQILCDSATDLGRERSFQGRGLLDVLRAFQSV